MARLAALHFLPPNIHVSVLCTPFVYPPIADEQNKSFVSMNPAITADLRQLTRHPAPAKPTNGADGTVNSMENAPDKDEIFAP